MEITFASGRCQPLEFSRAVFCVSQKFDRRQFRGVSQLRWGSGLTFVIFSRRMRTSLMRHAISSIFLALGGEKAVFLGADLDGSTIIRRIRPGGVRTWTKFMRPFCGGPQREPRSGYFL